MYKFGSNRGTKEEVERAREQYIIDYYLFDTNAFDVPEKTMDILYKLYHDGSVRINKSEIFKVLKPYHNTNFMPIEQIFEDGYYTAEVGGVKMPVYKMKNAAWYLDRLPFMVTASWTNWDNVKNPEPLNV